MTFSEATISYESITGLIFLAFFLFQARRLYPLMPGKKFIFWAVCRTLALLCILLSLAGFQLSLAAKDTATIFLVDRSLSAAPYWQAAEEYINRQVELHKGPQDQVAVISFAAEPMLEVPFTGTLEKIQFRTDPNPEFTNIQAALELAASLFPPQAQKRLVLISDARENTGQAAPFLRSLREKKINLVFYPLVSREEDDVQLSRMELPPSIYRGETVPLELELRSNFATQATFCLFDGTEQLFSRELQLQPGRNHFTFPLPMDMPGTDLRGEIDARGDTNPHNNVLTITPRFRELNRVLVVGNKEETANLNALLDSLGLERVSRDPKDLPKGIDFLASFRLIILAGVPHSDLPPGFEQDLQQAVRQLGTGLIVVGGENTFALGGYEDTLLEELLPVRSRMAGQRKLPDTGIVFILDVSGSMEDEQGGVQKLAMAKEGVLRAVATLEENDLAGVLAFADVQEWVVPLQKARAREEIARGVEKLAPRGGTLIRPALYSAYQALREADVKIRHIVLLSDGLAEQEGYEELLEALSEAKITLTTVAVGTGADTELLEYLASLGGGRHYHALSPAQLPEIFTKESYLAARTYLNNTTFYPCLEQGQGLIGTEELPPLHGYIGTGLKEGAALVLSGPEQDPLLAYWQYGLGRVLAWTSDLSGRWSRDWIAWEGLPEQWGRLISFCLGGPDEDGLEVQILQEGAVLELAASVEPPAWEQDQSLLLTAAGPGEWQQQLSLQRTAAHTYRGSLELPGSGSYLLTFQLLQGDTLQKQAVRRVHLDYSPEYALDFPGRGELYHLLLNYVLADPETNLFALPLPEQSKTLREVETLLLTLALLFFAADSYIRRT